MNKANQFGLFKGWGVLKSINFIAFLVQNIALSYSVAVAT